ncbi:penicillin-binding protein [Streptomyces sp. 8K308]|uniref:transglycosylase domain-containing protein n=1 Tax=Streptomyces sp. 8K308 TaxID=2530388 RepID=UPI00104CC46D|nr:transglycosylase domain-containing protein [Streptomyces sp. 8K308]TDC19688.1 penicillin-binding protein [Streptomyces sp. 8K308]
MGSKRPGGGQSATGLIARFLGVSVLSGAVLAGLALPAVGALGLAARGTMEGFDEIPAEMERPPLSQTSTILDAEGNQIAEVSFRNRTVVDLDQMGIVPQAVVAIEDARFYEHGAVDLQGIIRALTTNLGSGSVEQGASTLTQQYVKNVFVEAAGDDQEAIAEATQQTGAAGLGRKIQEIKYAIQLEQELTKDEILENYLNITYFGQQAYGIEAAAERYFSKSAADLELHEAAMLAGLVQSPSRYDPTVNPETALDRRNVVLQRMADNDAITQEEADAASEQELGLDISEPRTGCTTAVDDSGFFCDYVRQEILNNPVFGETEEDRMALWRLGGLTIQTTLDPQAQAAAAEAAREGADETDPVVAAVVQVEPGTGRILSMAQSRPYGVDATQNQTAINLNVSAGMGGSVNGFQPGSTFKPFTAAAALENGISPAQTYETDHEMTVEMDRFRNCENQPAGSGEWEVGNEREDEEGEWDMTSALAESINTYFVLLEEQTGLCDTVEMARSMGVTRGNDEQLPTDPSATLGAHETTPLMMANAYATFANRGTYCTPIAITSVTNAEGEELEVPESECEAVMSAHTADTINAMLGGVVEDGTGAAVGLTDRDNAGKTGTSDERRNVWFVGYTPEISTAVRVGGDAELIPMEDITIGGQYFERASGAGVAGPIWRQAMIGALEGVPAGQFNEVDVPRASDRERDREDGDRDEDDRDNGNGGNGGNDNGGGGNDSGDVGIPDIPDFPDIEWPDTWGNGNGNGNGGGRGQD